MLVHVADVARTIREAERFGIRARIEAVDWPAIVKRTFAEIDRDAAAIRDANRRAETIRVFEGSARFVGAEMAHVFGSLGTEVTIVTRGPAMVRDEDRDVSRRLTGPTRVDSGSSSVPRLGAWLDGAMRAWSRSAPPADRRPTRPPRSSAMPS
jgi:pyruvate/2-oxoglutarate dehydrogenase complex dihydrolipoamide dehydrogenase (E3) component